VVPALVLLPRLRDRWKLFAALTCCLVLLALSQTLYLHPHYAAPVTGLVFFLIVQGFRYLEWWQWRGRPIGRRLVSGTVALLVVLLFAPLAADLLGGQPHPIPQAPVAARLNGIPGRHLVVVRFGPNHSCHDEWVYNGADIDGSRIVWAHDMGP